MGENRVVASQFTSQPQCPQSHVSSGCGGFMDLDYTIQQFQRAAIEFAKGDPAPVKAIFSHRDDVVLANPFGPAVSGWNNVSAALDLASSRFRDGDVTAF